MTGEQPALSVEKRTLFGVSLEVLVSLVLAVGTVVGLYLGLRASVADAQARVGSAEVRIERLERAQADQAVTNQRLADDLEHIRQVTDQTARDVKDLQKRGGQ